MYIMCVCLFSALRHRVGALQISIIIIIRQTQQTHLKDWQAVQPGEVLNVARLDVEAGTVPGTPHHAVAVHACRQTEPQWKQASLHRRSKRPRNSNI